MCGTANFGVDAGSITISATGPAVTRPTASTVTVRAGAETNVLAVVDQRGTLTVTNASPAPDATPCTASEQEIPVATP